MPKITVIMPVYGVERFVADAVESVLAQSFTDFELLIIDDMSPDNSIAICENFDDPRIRIIRHRENRGLAGARNTGIRHSHGELLAFIDSDDCWHPEKLAQHVEHLALRPLVGVSFSRSAFIDENNIPNQCYQMPRLTGVEPGYILCRNPIGNGSAPVIRRAVFDAIRYEDDYHGSAEDWYFDERLRRSEDIECWIRIALTTDWQIEGIPEALTLYRLNTGGLSANLLQQFESWQLVIEKTRRYAPDFIAQWERNGTCLPVALSRAPGDSAVRRTNGDAARQPRTPHRSADPAARTGAHADHLVCCSAAADIATAPVSRARATGATHHRRHPGTPHRSRSAIARRLILQRRCRLRNSLQLTSPKHQKAASEKPIFSSLISYLITYGQVGTKLAISSASLVTNPAGVVGHAQETHVNEPPAFTASGPSRTDRHPGSRQ